jgi:hypothetical protein
MAKRKTGARKKSSGSKRTAKKAAPKRAAVKVARKKVVYKPDSCGDRRTRFMALKKRLHFKNKYNCHKTKPKTFFNNILKNLQSKYTKPSSTSVKPKSKTIKRSVTKPELSQILEKVKVFTSGKKYTLSDKQKDAQKNIAKKSVVLGMMEGKSTPTEKQILKTGAMCVSNPKTLLIKFTSNKK